MTPVDEPWRPPTLETTDSSLILTFNRCVNRNVTIKVGRKRVTVNLFRDGRVIFRQDFVGRRLSKVFEPVNHPEGFVVRAMLPDSSGLGNDVAIGAVVLERVRNGEVVIMGGTFHFEPCLRECKGRINHLKKRRR